MAFASLVASPATRCACPAKTAAVAPSRTATPSCMTRTARTGMTAPTFRCRTLPTARRRSPSSTRILSEEAVLGFEYGYAVRRTQHADDLGSPVRRLRQRRAGRHRPVHRLRRGEVGSLQRPDDDAAARLRRPGPRAQLGAPGALHAAGCGQQHADRAAHQRQAQIFHVLRRQMLRMFRKPLVHHDAQERCCGPRTPTSPLSDFTKGEFKTVIGEVRAPTSSPTRSSASSSCSGKVYYDLVKARTERKNHDVAIIRVEQLYPFPHKAFANEMKKYPNCTDVVWCQDEPQNQGAWFFVQHYIHENMVDGQKLGYAGRPASASRRWVTPTCTRNSRRLCSSRRSASSRASSSPSKSVVRGAFGCPEIRRVRPRPGAGPPGGARRRRTPKKEKSWQSLK